jgi:hypothetical protein
LKILKGQEISKANSFAEKATEMFWWISALASEMGQIKIK